MAKNKFITPDAADATAKLDCGWECKTAQHAGSLVASFKRRTSYKWCWDNSEAVWKKSHASHHTQQ